MDEHRRGAAANHAAWESEEPATIICQGYKRKVQVRAAKGAKQTNPRHVGFTEERRAMFLSHFAATCNATAAAEAVGVSPRTVYNWRRDNEAFRKAWEQALDQGYARLEAALVRRASEGVQVEADERAADAAERAIDPKIALAVLDSYRRQVGGARTGEILAQPYDIDEVRARLEAKMRALRPPQE